ALAAARGLDERNLTSRGHSERGPVGRERQGVGRYLFPVRVAGLYHVLAAGERVGDFPRRQIDDEQAAGRVLPAVPETVPPLFPRQRIGPAGQHGGEPAVRRDGGVVKQGGDVGLGVDGGLEGRRGGERPARLLVPEADGHLGGGEGGRPPRPRDRTD